MDREKQQKAPFVEALEGYCQQHMEAYHTPGHKLGQGISAYQANLFGDACGGTWASCMLWMTCSSLKGR